MRYFYLAALVLSWGGVLWLGFRVRLGLEPRRVLRAMVLTVALFLAFDAAGVLRGWFRSSPTYNVVFFPPGIPLEEPVLLGFLVLLSVSLYRLAMTVLP
ncbi:MAG: hypothetical protein M0027_15715 [Candidatus Dormibacteraeota bacterium]|jgi:hypothetical protein|nr:hypothetical protein [Candidatus Dormibacteraeota bacterium]